jgi:hypothetical protein
VSACHFSVERLVIEETGVPESGAPHAEYQSILCPCFWDYQKFVSHVAFRGAIPNPAEFELVICILWSRLGPLLDSTFNDA